jgi:transaldolase
MNDINRLARLHDAGVSIWLDSLSRELLETGELGRLIREDFVSGATSNPTIFAKALAGTERYAPQLANAVRAGLDDPREAFFTLALEDVRRAAGELRDAHDAASGNDGFVSFECTPDVADDTDDTIAQALALWHRLDAPNVMIKVPATAAGVPAIEELTARGVNVNVTLLFSVDRYEEVMGAYLRGLERRAEANRSIDAIRSVASFFVSRVDSKADALLPPGHTARGRVAVANASIAYARYLERFAGGRWEALHARGAAPQRPLWASTGTKNPEYSDVLYVERLVARDVVNTMPIQTLRAFADHGEVGEPLTADASEAERVLAAAADAGLDLARITAELEREGVEAFCDSYAQILSAMEQELTTARGRALA